MPIGFIDEFGSAYFEREDGSRDYDISKEGWSKKLVWRIVETNPKQIMKKVGENEFEPIMRYHYVVYEVSPKSCLSCQAKGLLTPETNYDYVHKEGCNIIKGCFDTRMSGTYHKIEEGDKALSLESATVKFWKIIEEKFLTLEQVKELWKNKQIDVVFNSECRRALKLTKW